MVYTCKSCPTPGFCRGSSVLTVDGMNPPDVFKGPIARSVLYSIDRYPRFARKLNEDVLNLDLATTWDRDHPITKPEQAWLNYIEKN